MKKVGVFFILIASIFTLFSCKNTAKSLMNVKISRDPDFGYVAIHADFKTLSLSELNLGDSLDFKFSNGYELKNIPYFDGYYGKKGDFMFVAYPTYTYPVLLKQYEENIFDLGHLTENDTVTISLNKKDGFKDYQEAFSIKYSNDRGSFAGDEIFANYRNIALGNIKPDRLYRAASACDNTAKRAPYVSDLMSKDKIDYVFDLSNTKEKLNQYALADLTPEYWKTLYNKNKVFDCKMSPNFYSSEIYSSVKKLCDGIIDNNGKYLFHCFEGKDRTGFVAILLEALCGASFDEIETDYFITYKNYYNLTKESELNRYQLYRFVRLFPMTNHIIGKEADDDATKEDLYSGAVNYLNKCGLTSERIKALIDKLTK